MARVRALIDGHWHPSLSPDDPLVARLRARPTTYREWITPDGAPGPAGQPARIAEPGRYHLYVSHACPWAHRAILYRRLKGLENVITMSVLHPRMAGAASWTFGESPWSTPDHLYGSDFLHEVYTRGDPRATTVVTVPMLWDRATETIVNRESGDIIRMLDRAFDAWGDAAVRFRPPELETEIERMNAFVIPRVSAAVYRVGFAADQDAYERELADLFGALDSLETQLKHRRYLLADTPTESDWHLFATLVRFDVAYHYAFKCNLRRLVDYPYLWPYARDLYQTPGVSETVVMSHIKDDGYYQGEITPIGPDLDFEAPHDRDRLPGGPPEGL